MKRATAGNSIKAQGAAFKLFDQYGFYEPGQIDLEALVLDRGLTIKIGGLHGCEARLIRLGKKGIIRVKNEDLKIHRNRFAVAHELGHWELHADNQGFICTTEQLRDYKTDPKESEANTFASELLMPTSLLRPIIETSESTIGTAVRISEMFNVSITAAAIRMVLETRFECCLVLSKDRCLIP